MIGKSYGQIWMFHYVQPESERVLPHLNCCSLYEFCRILDRAMEQFIFPHPLECLDHLKLNGFLPKGSCLLTFDDGTQDHYQWVYPELLRRNLSGIFFVATEPLTEARLLKVHKSHVLYGLMGYDHFFEMFVQHFRNSGGGMDVFNDDEAESAYPYDKKEIAGFKYALNFKINSNEVESILDDLLQLTDDVGPIRNNYYLTKENMRLMQQNGMVFGYHGHSHKAFSQLTEEGLLNELRESKEFFIDTIREAPSCISYPFGDVNCVEDSQVAAIKDFGVDVGFFAENIPFTDSMKCSRTDCIELMKSNKQLLK